jgi:hypothetical protein
VATKRKSPTAKNEELSAIQILKYKSKRGKNELHSQNTKIDFFSIEIQQVYN